MSPRPRETLVSLALCAFAYLFVSPYYPAINNPNENVRLYMTAAIVEEGRYEIDSLRKRWGYVNDAAVHGGHVYSVKAPGTSLLGVPAYAVVRALSKGPVDRDVALTACRITASVLPTLLFLFFFHRFLGRVSTDVVFRESIFFSVALGSLLYGYALLFVSHTVSAACAFGAFILLADDTRTPRAWSTFAAGLLAAGVTLFEYPGLVISVALCGLALYRFRKQPRALFVFCAGALIPTLAMMHFQASAFGSPFTPGHLYVENDSFRAAHHEGLYGAVGVSGAALYGLLLDPGAGLFPLTPVLCLAPLGAIKLWRSGAQRALLVTALILTVGTVLVIAAMNNWRGGWTIGPRYLAGCVPFLGWLALHGLSSTQEIVRPWLWPMAVAGLITALVMSGTLSAYYPHLPKELTRPVAQLLPPLLEGGYAPRNALGLFDWHGGMTMLPLLLCALVVVVRSSAGSLLVLLPGSALAFVLIAGLTLPSDDEGRALKAVSFITRRWSPAGYDRASLLRAQLVREKVRTREEVDALVHLYETQGRRREAKAAQRLRPP